MWSGLELPGFFYEGYRERRYAKDEDDQGYKRSGGGKTSTSTTDSGTTGISTDSGTSTDSETTTDSSEITIIEEDPNRGKPSEESGQPIEKQEKPTSQVLSAETQKKPTFSTYNCQRQGWLYGVIQIIFASVWFIIIPYLSLYQVNFSMTFQIIGMQLLQLSWVASSVLHARAC